MRLVAVLLSLLLLPFTVRADDEAPAARPAGRPKLVVNDLKGQGIDADTASTLTDTICAHLAQRKKEWSVLCTEDVKTIVAARDVQLRLGHEDGASVDEIAALVKARYVLSGSIGRSRKKIVFSLSILDVDNSDVIARTSYAVDEDGDLLAAAKKAAEELVK